MNTNQPNVYIHPTAVVDDGAVIGSGTKVWHFSHIFSKAVVGENCYFGQNTMVSDGVNVGSNVKVQNNVAIYTGTVIEDDVFLGPSCVLTNVSNPRSQVVRHRLYETTCIRHGATVGANATIVCGTVLGRYSFVAAGAVVTKDVPDYGFVVGVPAKQIGWMSRHGHPLDFDSNNAATCPESGFRYQLGVDESSSPFVRCLDLSEDEHLPDSLATGSQSYREFKKDGA